MKCGLIRRFVLPPFSVSKRLEPGGSLLTKQIRCQTAPPTAPEAPPAAEIGRGEKQAPLPYSIGPATADP